jgi:hypothetical protein
MSRLSLSALIESPDRDSKRPIVFTSDDSHCNLLLDIVRSSNIQLVVNDYLNYQKQRLTLVYTLNGTNTKH